MTTRVNLAQPDITLTLDLEGVIRGASLGSGMPDQDGIEAWVGRPWIETVGEAAEDKIQRMLEDARANGVSGFRQVTQRFPSGRELPIEYTTIRLGGRHGLIAVGKNLQAVTELQARLVAAQHAREQDYWKLREIETRSRLLFDAAAEAVLVVRGDGFRVVEANPAAIRKLGVAPGWDLMAEIAERDRDAFRAMLVRAREQGRAPGILLHLGPLQEGFTARASLMTTDPGPIFLVQLAAVSTPSGQPEPTVAYDGLVEILPDAFVVVDGQGHVRRANRAFLDLVEVGAELPVVGERIGRWVGRPGADAALLLGMVQRHGVARLFPTAVQGELGTETEVEISAIGQGQGEDRQIGLLIRDVTRRLPQPQALQDPLARALSTINAQVGRTSLGDMVRETTATVERHCIETALQMANGRRTLAAELLGVSRQSLYTKLDRYGIQDLDATAPETDG